MSALRRILLVAALAAVGAVAVSASASARTVWLCKPGLAHDPCNTKLATTVFSPSGKRLRVTHPKADRRPAIDCFYVYPTVSGQKTGNANRHVDPEERSIALYQAARYRQHCRVFAPMYRQLTLLGIGLGKPTTPPNAAIGPADVRAAFADYLKHYNHGRGFVLIGHSQGSFVLRDLIAKDVDRKPSVRRRLVSAILLGGNVLVRKGSDVGGDFKHVRACHSARQLHCVIAFSTFDTPVPPTAIFGRTKEKNRAVLCTNPAALGGGSALVDSVFPSRPFYQSSPLAAGIKLLGLTLPTARTPWIEVPGAFRARCSSAGGAHVLQVTPQAGIPTPHPSPDANWGLHLIDANVALGDLVRVVATEAKAYTRSHRAHTHLAG